MRLPHYWPAERVETSPAGSSSGQEVISISGQAMDKLEQLIEFSQSLGRILMILDQIVADKLPRNLKPESGNASRTKMQKAGTGAASAARPGFGPAERSDPAHRRGQEGFSFRGIICQDFNPAGDSPDLCREWCRGHLRINRKQIFPGQPGLSGTNLFRLWETAAYPCSGKT